MFFGKKQEEKKEPTLLGDDFDIFPDMGEKKKAPVTEIADEKEEEEEIEVEPSKFEAAVAALDEKTWKKYQIIFGAVLGVLSGLSLTVLNHMATMQNYSLIIAAVLALLVPNIVEKKAIRKMPVARIALIVTLGVSLGAYLLYGLVINPGFFAAIPAA